MTSRKKAKGKGRKAKKEQAELLKRCICCWWANTDEFSTQSMCHHGHDHNNADPKDMAVCNNFITDLMRLWEREGGDELEDLHLDYKDELYSNPTRKELLKQMLISMAVNYLLKNIPADIDRQDDAPLQFDDDCMYGLISSIEMIEEFKYNADMYLKILDVTTETSNSVHFLKKGISCGCLDEVHKKLFIEGNKRCVAAIPPVNNE